MSHDKMPHNNKCHLASCLRLLKYLALFCVLKSVAAAPFPSSPVAGVADGNGVLFRDATFLQRADALTRQFLAMESLWPPVTELTGATPMVFFHQRKAGGSSIRAVLHRVCTDANLQCYIICHIMGSPATRTACLLQARHQLSMPGTFLGESRRISLNGTGTVHQATFHA